MTQLHKRITDEDAKRVFELYVLGEVSRHYVQTYCSIKKTRFFELLRSYKKNPEFFTLSYARKTSNRRLAPEIEPLILQELKQAHELITNPSIPIYTYNYSYIRDVIQKDYGYAVAVSTISKKAKDYGFYLPKRIKKTHDREVLTNYVGELVQHDTSHHLFTPLALEKWHLITSLDDYSRFLLFAKFFSSELSWHHIDAHRHTSLSYGVPHKYYVDSHSIFRFVQGRDSVWREHKKFTDEINTQWKQVILETGSDSIPALSPQAKGKIERPYRWLQDRVVRACMREGITTMTDAQNILDQEVERYNYKQVHSTTLEVPFYRFQKALHEQKTLFHPFSIQKPYSSLEDVFCFRDERVVDAYHKISFDNSKFFVHDVPLYEKVLLRISPDFSSQTAMIRIWYNGSLKDRYTMPFSALKSFSFS